MTEKDSIQGTLGHAEAPVIPASKNLPEITLRGILLGTVLTIVLAAANAWLGLRMGQTISASIPAAIISMSLLRFFRNSNMLENTMVQTMASVGESLIAGVTFSMPALIILHVWDHFPYWQTVCISFLGGMLGVLFTIPLRRALLADRTLRYPEGVAISNVLKAGSENKANDMKTLAAGGLVGGLVSLFQSGFQILTDTFDYWVISARHVMGFELGLSPAMIASGYIVGVNVAISFIVGITIGWLAGVPILSAWYGLPSVGDATSFAMDVWKSHIRYIGVGTMLVGGLWTLCTLFKPIARSIAASFATLRTRHTSTNQPSSLRTERDIPIHYVLWGIVLMLVPLFLLITHSIIPTAPGLSHTFHVVIAGFTVFYILFGGFLFCSISSYFAGLIGSSNTPVSGLLISSLLIFCLALLAIFSLTTGISGHELFGTLLGIGSSVVICVALAIANDTMQDLKVGQIVGATPWKQQAMLVFGVLISSFVVPPILDLLYQAYGIGGVFPHPGMNPSQMLAAPQAGLMATVAKGVYTNHLEWNMIITGAVIAFLCIGVDEFVKKHWNTRLPVLAVGLGIYLPMNATVPVVIGGLLSWLVQTRLRRTYRHLPTEQAIKASSPHRHRGLLLACGLAAGGSIMSVLLAIPFAMKQSSDAMKIMPDHLQHLAGFLSIAVIVILCFGMYYTVMRRKT